MPQALLPLLQINLLVRMVRGFLCALAFILPAQASAQELRADIPVGGGQYVDVYIPDAAQPRGIFRVKRNVPVLVYVHGGGWIKGDRTKVYSLPEYANERGYMLVSVSYRPIPRTNIDGQVADIARAINWTRNNIGKLGGDNRRIVIMGHSAGAHLVSMVAAQRKGGQLRGVVANDVQAYDMVAYASLRGSIDGVYKAAFGSNPSDWVRWSPITWVKQGRSFPPFLVMYSNSHRPRREQVSVAFASELKRRGTRVSLFDGRRYTHGSIASGIGKSAEVTGALDRFLRSAFR